MEADIDPSRNGINNWGCYALKNVWSRKSTISIDDTNLTTMLNIICKIVLNTSIQHGDLGELQVLDVLQVADSKSLAVQTDSDQDERC